MMKSNPEKWAHFITNEEGIRRLVIALGAEEAKKVIDLIYNENIADGDVERFVNRIGIAEEKRRIKWAIYQYLARHPEGERAHNDAEFVDEIVELTFMLRDDYIEGLVSDIEAAILCIAIGDHSVKEHRFIEMAKSLFPIYTK